MQITNEILHKILDNSSDEIFVMDADKKIVYVNRVCERHYGLKPSEVIGRDWFEIYQKGYWYPSIVPTVYEQKKPVTIKQTTYLGTELVTTAVPLLNDKQEIELVVVNSSQLQNFRTLKVGSESASSDQSESVVTQPTIISNSEQMKRILTLCKKIAPVDSTVLIQGESGTGKGLLAEYIHNQSLRKKGPLLTINCAAIPEELLESELFGYTQGAFTGANKTGKMGLIEAANNGTLFLDEIGEISLRVQAKLLQVIQHREFIPIGEREPRKVNIRIIAATNCNLQEMVKQKKFREDLYYRLNVIDIKIPPLRERPEDIIPLTYYFLNKFNSKYGVNRLISDATLQVFSRYSWPGNIRHLENLMEKLVVTTDSVIDTDDLPEIFREFFTTHSPADRGNQPTNSQHHAENDLHTGILPDVHQAAANVPPERPIALNELVSEVERDLIIKAYQQFKSSRKVAKHLQISQTKASRLIRKYCRPIERP